MARTFQGVTVTWRLFFRRIGRQQSLRKAKTAVQIQQSLLFLDFDHVLHPCDAFRTRRGIQPSDPDARLFQFAPFPALRIVRIWRSQESDAASRLIRRGARMQALLKDLLDFNPTRLGLPSDCRRCLNDR
jgi:hypothetical protein